MMTREILLISATFLIATKGDIQDSLTEGFQQINTKPSERSQETFLAELDKVLDLEKPDLMDVLIGGKHKVVVPDFVVTHICLRNQIQDFDGLLEKYIYDCPNLDSGDLNIACYLGRLMTQDRARLSKHKFLKNTIYMCELWWKLGIKNKRLTGLKDAELGQCLSKLISQSCDVGPLIGRALAA